MDYLDSLNRIINQFIEDKDFTNLFNNFLVNRIKDNPNYLRIYELALRDYLINKDLLCPFYRIRIDEIKKYGYSDYYECESCFGADKECVYYQIFLKNKWRNKK